MSTTQSIQDGTLLDDEDVEMWNAHTVPAEIVDYIDGEMWDGDTLGISHYVRISGDSVAMLKKHVTAQQDEFDYLNDPEHRTKEDQLEDSIVGLAAEHAVHYVCDYLMLPVKRLEDTPDACAFDLLWMPPDGAAPKTIEVKGARVDSQANFPLRTTKGKDMEQMLSDREGRLPDVAWHNYFNYDAESDEIIIGVGMVAPVEGRHSMMGIGRGGVIDNYQGTYFDREVFCGIGELIHALATRSFADRVKS